MPKALKRTLRVLLVLFFVCLGLGAVGGAMWAGDKIHERTYINKEIPDYDPTRPIPTEALKEDFAIIRGAIENEHGAPYLYTSKKDLSAMFDAAYAELNKPMSEIQFVKLVGPIIHAVHDGHTNFDLSFTFREDYVFGQPIFPATTFFSKDKVFVWHDGTADKRLPRGSEIMAIDGEPVGALIEQITDLFVSRDGYTVYAARQTLEGAGDMRDGFMTYLAYLKNFPESYTVQLRTPEGVEKTTQVKGERVGDIFTAIHERYPPTDGAEENETATRFHWYGDVPVLTIDSFSDDRETFEDYAETLEHAFTEIHNRKASNLVIDLRENGGGGVGRPFILLKYFLRRDYRVLNSCKAKTFRSRYEKYSNEPWSTYTINQLYKLFLMRRNKARDVWVCRDAALTGELNLDNPPLLTFPEVALPPFEGNVFLLVSGSTFSAGSEFVVFAKTYVNPLTVVGQETGGTATGLVGGRYWALTLPNTRLRLRVPLIKMDFVGGETLEPGRGVIPDYEVWPTFEDYVEDRDRVLETALKLARKTVRLNARIFSKSAVCESFRETP